MCILRVLFYLTAVSCDFVSAYRIADRPHLLRISGSKCQMMVVKTRTLILRLRIRGTTAVLPPSSYRSA